MSLFTEYDERTGITYEDPIDKAIKAFLDQVGGGGGRPSDDQIAKASVDTLRQWVTGGRITMEEAEAALTTRYGARWAGERISEWGGTPAGEGQDQKPLTTAQKAALTQSGILDAYGKGKLTREEAISLYDQSSGGDRAYATQKIVNFERMGGITGDTQGIFGPVRNIQRSNAAEGTQARMAQPSRPTESSLAQAALKEAQAKFGSMVRNVDMQKREEYDPATRSYKVVEFPYSFELYNPETQTFQRHNWDFNTNTHTPRGNPALEYREELAPSQIQRDVFGSGMVFDRNRGESVPGTRDPAFGNPGERFSLRLGGPEGTTPLPRSFGPVARAGGAPLLDLPSLDPISERGFLTPDNRDIQRSAFVPLSFTPAGERANLFQARGTDAGYGTLVGGIPATSTSQALGYRLENNPGERIRQELAAQAMIEDRVNAGEDRNAVVGGIRAGNFAATRAPQGVFHRINDPAGQLPNTAFRSPSGFFVNSFGRPVSEPGGGFSAMPMAPLPPVMEFGRGGRVMSYQEGGEVLPRRREEDPDTDTGGGLAGVNALNPQFGTGGGSPPAPGQESPPVALPPSEPNAPVPSTAGEPPDPATAPTAARIGGAFQRYPDQATTASGNYSFFEFPFGATLNAEGNTEEENRANAAAFADTFATEDENRRLLGYDRFSPRLQDLVAREGEIGAMQAYEPMRALSARFQRSGIEPYWQQLARRQDAAQALRNVGINRGDIGFQQLQNTIDLGRLGRRSDIDRANIAARAAGPSAVNRFAQALASAHASAQARAAIANQQQAIADADAAARAAALGQTSAGSPWQGGFGTAGGEPGVNPATAGSSPRIPFPEFARGGTFQPQSMMVPEEVIGVGRFTGTPYFRLNERMPFGPNPNPERLDITPLRPKGSRNIENGILGGAMRGAA